MKKCCQAFILLTVFISALNCYAQNIYTYGGNGSAGFSGDGGLATLAQVKIPLGITSDASGNIYISDTQNHRIRQINGLGNINTIAGGGASVGDGGPAINAMIGSPYKIAFDIAGNMYIAEFGNNRIRKINTMGIITTVAGDGSIVGGFTGDGGPATTAKLNGPSAVAVDASGNLYIADMSNNRIRMVNAVGTITTIAGTGGNAYMGDGGPAILAQLNLPQDVKVDPSGNILIADYANRCVRKINSSGIISTIAGTGVQGNTGDGGPATSAQIGSISAIELDISGNLYIADGGYGVIRKVNTLGIISTIAGTGTQGYSGDGGPALLAQIFPHDISLDNNGNVYIADGPNNRIRIVCVSSCVLGINENQSLVNLKIYPNPVSNNLSIQMEEIEFPNSEIEITNYLDQTVLKTEFKNQIDVSKLASGIYNLKIVTKDNRSYYSKFVKE